MNNEQKQRALQMLRRFERAVPMTRQSDNAAVAMATMLQDLIDAPQAPAVQTDHPEHHLEMVKQELFQAQQALLNEVQQRDKLLEALVKIDAAAKESTTIIGFSSKAFRMLGEIREIIAEARGDK